MKTIITIITAILLNSSSFGQFGSISQMDSIIEIFPLNYFHIPFSPVDATSYYFSGRGTTKFPSVEVTERYQVVHLNCTLIGYTIITIQNGAAASGEASSIYISIKNKKEVLLSDNVTFSPIKNQTRTVYKTISPAINLEAGEEYAIKWLTPIWGVNPMSANVNVVIHYAKSIK